MKNNRSITKYFKEYRKSFPSRDYLLNIVNTVNDNAVIKAVNTVKEKREKKQTTEAPIVITNEFARMLE